MARSGARAAKAGTGRRLLPMAQGLLLGALVILATPTAVLLAVLLLPTAMSMLVESTPGRPATRAVALFGLAGACMPLDALWRSGHDFGTTLVLATDIRTLAVGWSAQAGGWLLTQLLPFAVGLVLQARSGAEQARLRRRREAIEAEWAREAGPVR